MQHGKGFMEMKILRRLPRFEYLAPSSIQEACFLLKTYGDKAKALAGGTDLLIDIRRRKVIPSYIVGLRNIPGTDYISYHEANGLRIGALATLNAIASSPVIREKFGLLATACQKVGNPQIRNMGTIGGNVCTGGPSQDTPPCLLALEAKLKLVSADGERLVPITEFFSAPFQTVLGNDEILSEIQIANPPPRSAGCYHWLTKRTAVDETLVGVAALVTLNAEHRVCTDIRLGLGSVASTVMRARQAEEFLRGKAFDGGLVEEAATLAASETRPRSRAAYRQKMTAVLVRKAVEDAIKMVE
jgi:carbon-monoxide dehydrogenase medium subunit